MRLALALVLGIVLVALTACDDDDDSSDDDDATTPVETISPPEEQPGDGEDGDTVTLSLFYPRLTESDFELVEVQRETEETEAVGTAALELLIEGPTAEEEADLDISDPIPAGTELLSLEIKGGLATADFSAALLDFGGGSLNVRTIMAMIEETLRQFPTVEEVVILVEGQPDALQP
jgi:spore germination protein GerM